MFWIGMVVGVIVGAIVAIAWCLWLDVKAAGWGVWNE